MLRIGSFQRAAGHCLPHQRKPLAENCVLLLSRSLSDHLSATTENLSTPLEIIKRCEKLHTQIQPLNDRLKGPLERSSHKTTALPFVLLLGNHSSGKSSFINYVLGRQIQTSGVAPTDDSFTIIAPGTKDIDQDGPALVGDPDMGFTGLRHFGPGLIHHMQLKIRTDTTTNNFMMVDSPGMIDSPASRASTFSDSEQLTIDRGYEFDGVVRWFAERADVILLFFDPDKPGTTGETLSILTNSLAGLDHKLYIILNKADQFSKIHDFARAYGSLCWNLSKVIPRKDLPKIFTMCLPVPNTHGQEPGSFQENGSSMGRGLEDLYRTRDDVVAEVHKAPKRRIDNLITRLADSVHLLHMHATICEAARKEHSAHLWNGRMMMGGSSTLAASLVAGSVYSDLVPMEVSIGLTGFGLAGVAGLQWYTSKLLEVETQRLLGPEGLSKLFEATHSGSLSEGDASTMSLWQRIRDKLQSGLSARGLQEMSKVSDSELADLQRILDDEVPKLRRLNAPLDYEEMQKQGFNF